MELNPEIDLSIDLDNLTTEFREFPILMYRYSQQRSMMETQRDVAEANLKEIKAIAYKRLKSDISVKHTQSSLEAEVDTDPSVIDARKKLIRTEHDAATWAGAVESMRAKKDCLVQLGSDRRKEM